MFIEIKEPSMQSQMEYTNHVIDFHIALPDQMTMISDPRQKINFQDSFDCFPVNECPSIYSSDFPYKKVI